MSKSTAKTAGPVSIPAFHIDSEVTRCIRQHARSHMKTEVCGVLIGEIRNDRVEIQASIEALNAAQAGTHVTFTQDAWETIYKVKDESYPEERIVGWYHSHPGFGVFLSEHDTFIHRNFFSSPDQIAWVYDPHTDEEGCFGWVDGEIHRIGSLTIVDTNGDGLERTPKEMEPWADFEDERPAPTGNQATGERQRHQPSWLRWSTIALGYVAAIMAGFAVAFFLFPRPIMVIPDPASGRLVVLPDEYLQRYEQMQREAGRIAAPQQAPSQPPNKAAPGPNSGGSK
jgi:proteasome lid subunit RPN8/RPN11